MLKGLFTIELKDEEYDPIQGIPLQYANKNLFFTVWGYDQDNTATLKKKFLDVFTAGEIKIKNVKIGRCKN
ncbi:hypothetical protein BH10BAC2_BH10BAC2_29190 [soil metagenome]